MRYLQPLFSLITPLHPLQVELFSGTLAWVRGVEYFCVLIKIQINFVTSKLLPCYYFRISTLISNNKPQHGCYFTLYSLTKIINLIRKKNQVTFLFHSFNDVAFCKYIPGFTKRRHGNSLFQYFYKAMPYIGHAVETVKNEKIYSLTSHKQTQMASCRNELY